MRALSSSVHAHIYAADAHILIAADELIYAADAHTYAADAHIYAAMMPGLDCYNGQGTEEEIPIVKYSFTISSH